MWFFARFGTIFTIEKREKTPMEECYFLVKLQAEVWNLNKSNTPAWEFLHMVHMVPNCTSYLVD